SFGTVTYNYTIDIVVFGSAGVGGLVGGNTGQVNASFTSSDLNVTTWSSSGPGVNQAISAGTLIGFEQSSALVALHRFGANDSSTATATISDNKCAEVFPPTAPWGGPTTPNPAVRGPHPGPNPDTSAASRAANARSQAQSLTQQATAQQT